MEQVQLEAALITGVYGSGKSSVVEEMADVLEKRGTPYAALDLDWLSWFDAGWDDDAAEDRMLLKNLEAVVANYRSADVERYILAFSIENDAIKRSLEGVLRMPTRVIRLTIDLETIEARLASSVTTGRNVDLHWAGIWLADGIGAGVEDLTISNDRPIQEVALDILGRLGWI